MIYYMRKLKVAVDFATSTFMRLAKCPDNATAVDLIALEPGNTVTRAEAITVNMRPATVLHISGFDMVMLASILGTLGMLKPRPSRAFFALFHGNPMDGLRTVCRAAFDLLAPGEFGAFKARQVNSRPDDWRALRTLTGDAANDFGQNEAIPDDVQRSASRSSRW